MQRSVRTIYKRPEFIVMADKDRARIYREEDESGIKGFSDRGVPKERVQVFQEGTVRYWGRILAFSRPTNQVLVEYVNEHNKVSRSLFNEDYVEIL